METFKSMKALREEYPENDYLVLTDSEADKKCFEYIADSLWAFNSTFLSGITKLDETIFKALSEKYEDGNEGIAELVKITCGMDYLVEQAISADGRGHFLAGYDLEEREVKVGKSIWYVYRQ